MIDGELLIFGFNILPLATMLLDVFLVVYFLVAIMVIRQIKFMTRTIQSPYNKVLYLIAYIHLFTVTMVLVFSLTAL